MIRLQDGNQFSVITLGWEKYFSIHQWPIYHWFQPNNIPTNINKTIINFLLAILKILGAKIKNCCLAWVAWRAGRSLANLYDIYILFRHSHCANLISYKKNICIYISFCYYIRKWFKVHLYCTTHCMPGNCWRKFAIMAMIVSLSGLGCIKVCYFSIRSCLLYFERCEMYIKSNRRWMMLELFRCSA